MGALDVTPKTWAAGEVVTEGMLNTEVRDKFDDLKTRFITDSGWVNITILGGFTAQAGAEIPQVRKIGSVVYLRGGWTNAGMAVNGTYSVGTIPSGYRPPVNTVGTAGSSTGAATCTVHMTTAGDVQIRTSGTLGAYYKIDRQSFLVN